MLCIRHFDVAKFAGGPLHHAAVSGVGTGIIVHRNERITAARDNDGRLATQVSINDHLGDTSAYRSALGRSGEAAGSKRCARCGVNSCHQGALAYRIVQTKIRHAGRG